MTSLRINRLAVISITATLFATSCSTTKRRSRSKSPSTLSSTSPKKGQSRSKQQKNDKLTARMVMDFYLKHVSQFAPLDLDDRMLLGKLTERPNRKNIPLYQASYYVGWLKTNVQQFVFQSKPSFESQMAEFARYARSNPLLQHPSVGHFTATLIETASQQRQWKMSDNWLQVHFGSLGERYQRVAAEWKKLGPTAQETGEVNQQLALAAKSGRGHAFANQNDENLLHRAEESAQSGDLNTAVAILSRIPSSSEIAPLAEKRKKELSTRAVQKLRRDAAVEYQKAMPVENPEEKKSMLLNARNHLETAIREFPDASPDQIERVRKNLNVIDEKIQQVDLVSQNSQTTPEE